MLISRIRNIYEYKKFRADNESYFNKIWNDERSLIPKDKKDFKIKGISYPIGEVVDFHVDFMYSNGIEPNWRERVVCPQTNLNNRLRACIHLLDFELGLRDYQQIYITEQVTPLYQYLKPKFPNLIGSEYLGPDFNSGFIDNNGVRHEDMTQLSLKDESIDHYLSFECFEHIPDFLKAFSEVYRVLKNDGYLFFTVPFANISHENIHRALLDDEGNICHILEPEYHGDPVNAGGVLCFTHFGWQMLDDLKNIGFKDAYAIIYWSDKFGYLGGEQMVFCARK